MIQPIEDCCMEQCAGCNKKLSVLNTSGYCRECFFGNVDNCKSKYNRSKWLSGDKKISQWKYRGAKLENSDIDEYNKVTNCEICNKEFDGDKVLDHDHITGIYRGALCRQCNSALGKLGDDLCLVIRRVSDYAIKLHGKMKQRGSSPEPSCLAD